MSKGLAIFQKRLLTTCILGLLLIPFSAAAQQSSPPAFKPSLEIRKLVGSITIDGNLDDSGWKNAARVDRFYEVQPKDNAQPEVTTAAYITYDNDNLYVAFDCKDNPAALHATMTQRDNISGDDEAFFLVDTYGDASWAYELAVNPYGVQADYLWSTFAGEDGSYDLIWGSAAQKTDSGYQVEMAIPFSALRFPNKDIQTWKVNFWRNRPRESRQQYSWAPQDRNERCWPCQWVTMTGLKDVHPGKGIEILPAFVSNKSDNLETRKVDSSVFLQTNKIKGELSLGGKYSITSNIVAEAAYNPDFSQIESDASQIDVNTKIALMYPERRPYFQEGSDIFRTLFNSFYTRMINDPQFTVKLTGRPGKTNIGFMSALDENTPYMIPMDQWSVVPDVGKSTVNVLRMLERLNNSSQLGFIATDRRYDGGGSGSILALDGDFKFHKSYRFSGQFISSYTTEPDKPKLGPSWLKYYDFNSGRNTCILDGESYKGTAFITTFSRNARHWNFYIDYNQLSPTYRTQTGYDPVNDHRTFDFSTSYQFLPKGGPFTSYGPGLYCLRRWDFLTGKMRQELVSLDLSGSTKIAQTGLDLSYFGKAQEYAGVDFSGIWGIALSESSRPSNNIGFGFDIGYARDIELDSAVLANQLSADANLYFKPIDRLTIEPAINFLQMTSPRMTYFSGYITRTRIKFQATKELSTRFIIQYNRFDHVWDVDPLLTYRLSPFSVFYFGSNYSYDYLSPRPQRDPLWQLSSRQYFMKLQYLFQT